MVFRFCMVRSPPPHVSVSVSPPCHVPGHPGVLHLLNMDIFFIKSNLV